MAGRDREPDRLLTRLAAAALEEHAVRARALTLEDLQLECGLFGRGGGGLGSRALLHRARKVSDPSVFARLRKRLRRKKYAPGAILSQFLAPDIKREVEVVDASEVDEGFVTVRIRTWNLLYVARGMGSVPEFKPPQRKAIEELWVWTGESWGGSVPGDG